MRHLLALDEQEQRALDADGVRYLIEAANGRPCGARELRKAMSRLDPKGTGAVPLAAYLSWSARKLGRGCAPRLAVARALAPAAARGIDQLHTHHLRAAAPQAGGDAALEEVELAGS
eukprot:gene13067-48695_t